MWNTDVESLLPCDLVQVLPLPSIASRVNVREEGFHTSGSPWKEGTLGCVLVTTSEPPVYYGVTAGHVQLNSHPTSPQEMIHTEVEEATASILKDPSHDVACV